MRGVRSLGARGAWPPPRWPELARPRSFVSFRCPDPQNWRKIPGSPHRCGRCMASTSASC